VKAMRETRGRKKAATNKLAGKKILAKYRYPSEKTQAWTGRGRKPAWAAELSEKGKLKKALIKN
jgi:DNA-binding protein H-NS